MISSISTCGQCKLFVEEHNKNSELSNVGCSLGNWHMGGSGVIFNKAHQNKNFGVACTHFEVKR